jgi:hypothetical protein
VRNGPTGDTMLSTPDEGSAMRRRLMVVLVVLVVLVSGCAGTSRPTPSVRTIPPDNRPPAVSTSPSSSSSETPVSPPSNPSTPAVPSTTGALNVVKFTQVDFASPSGGIWCGMAADYALCHIPFDGYKGQQPTTEQICPEEQLDVTGVNVTTDGASWFCSGDPSTMPVKGSTQVAWQKGTGFPFVKYDGQTLATLPYDKALRHGDYICRSERSGMTCASLVSKHGFKVARAGITLF